MRQDVVVVEQYKNVIMDERKVLERWKQDQNKHEMLNNGSIHPHSISR